jgi:hypothetical protein
MVVTVNQSAPPAPLAVVTVVEFTTTAPKGATPFNKSLHVDLDVAIF